MTATKTADRREAFDRWIPMNALELLVSRLDVERELGEEFGEEFSFHFRLPGSDDLWTELFGEGDSDDWTLEQRAANARSDLLVAAMAFRLADESDRLRELGNRFVRIADETLRGRPHA